MTILGTSGYVGIGAASPAFQLEVANDINLIPGTFPNSGYRWEDEVILKTNITTDNIFLGFNAGRWETSAASCTYLGAHSGEFHSGSNGGNTFVGWNAGFAGLNTGESVYVGSRSGENNGGQNNSFLGVSTGQNSTGDGNAFYGNFSGRLSIGDNNAFFGDGSGENNIADLNTFIGSGSGNLNTTGNNNAFVGGNSGSMNTTGRNLTFLGFEAGLNNINGANNTFGGTSSGHDNTTGDVLTFYGFESGFSNSFGINNTFSGSSSGRSNTMGNDNAFFGFRSGFTNDRGNENVFIGTEAGNLNVDGSRNTFTGFEAGYSNSMDNENSYYGNLSGRLINVGTLNTFVGSQSGSTITTGSTLTLIGANTIANNILTNSSAIGANASVTTSNSMILGDPTVNLGLGLSGNLSGPTNKLEINDNVNFGSGLTFRQLTSASMPTLTGVTKVLTVDGSGIVVLGDIPGGGGSISSCLPSGLTTIGFIIKITAFNEICKSNGVYESPTGPLFSVGIGVGSSPNAAYQLHMKGDFLISRTPTQTDGNICMENGSGIQRVFSQYGFLGYQAIAIGSDAGPSVLTGLTANQSIYVGGRSGRNTASNANNTFVGYDSGLNFAGAGNSNTFIGKSAAASMTQGDENTVLGHNAASVFFQQGFGNTLLGAQTITWGMERGDFNITLGYQATVTELTGLNNIIIGARATGNNGGTGNLTNAGTIGVNGRVNCSNCFTLASQQGFEQQVGIGFTNPSTTVVPAPIPPVPPLLPSPPATPAKLYVSNFNNGPTSAYFAGRVYATDFITVSDSNLKQNITPLTDVNDIIDQLEAKTYDFKLNSYPQLNLPVGDQFGFLAQDLEAVVPSLVTYIAHPSEYDSSGNMITPQTNFKSVNYAGLIPVLFTAIKQQNARMDSLEAALLNCCATPVINPGNENRTSIQLSNKSSIILNQNSPNPFKDKTEITYSIPYYVHSATILFYDFSGKVLNSFDITHKGEGTLTVYGDDLASGIYSYTLLIDGAVNKTKKMVKE